MSEMLAHTVGGQVLAQVAAVVGSYAMADRSLVAPFAADTYVGDLMLTLPGT